MAPVWLNSLMELEELAVIARGYISTCGWTGRTEEIAEGWYSIYNEATGQSKNVVHHLDSGYVFKATYGGERWTASGQYIGEIEIDGHLYPIRLPRFFYLGDIVAQEYIWGEHHDCTGGGLFSCEHTRQMSEITGYNDCHTGNWKIFNGEVVLFDFD